jgi:Zn-dependent peptidase ImmA (M78 family)
MLSRRKIELHARRLLNAARIDKPPVPVERVAKCLNIKVDKSDLGHDCSGVLIRQGDRAVIGVNRADHPNRERFTIAHEIGHYVLHERETYVDTGYRVNFRDLDSGSGTKSEEVEANRFAAALLMPEAMVKVAFNDLAFDLAGTKDDELRKLADLFGVSTQAMAYRLAVVVPPFS